MSEVIPFPVTPRVRQLLARAGRRALRARVARVDVDHLFLEMEMQSGSPVRALVHRAGYDVAELWADFRGVADEMGRRMRDEIPEDEFVGGLGI